MICNLFEQVVSNNFPSATFSSVATQLVICVLCVTPWTEQRVESFQGKTQMFDDLAAKYVEIEATS